MIPLKTYGRMPVQLPHALRLDSDIRRRNRLRNREVRAVDLPPLAAAAGRRLGRVLECAVHVRRVASEFSVAAGHVGVFCGGAVLDIRVGRRERSEDGFGEAERLGKECARGFDEPVCQIERCAAYFISDVSEMGGGKSYPALSKSASSNARRYSFSLSKPCTVCACPLGKYQMSPNPSSVTWCRLFSSTAETRTRPKRTWPHSAYNTISIAPLN